MRRTHPLLRNCRENAKKTKVRGPDSLELALEMRKKERKKKERLRNGHFFEHLVLAYTIDLMNDLGLVR